VNDTNATMTIISPPLLDKLMALRPLLEAGGCVQPHHNGYRVRYRQFDADQGFVVHRSLALGNNKEVAAAAKALIESWRLETEEAAAQAEQMRQFKAASDQQHRQLIAGIVQVHGGGQRRQRRAVKKFDEALEAGPRELFTFAFKQEFLEVHKAGRPCRRLW